MNTNLPAINSAQPICAGLPSTQELMVYQTWAQNAANSQMYRNIGKESGIMMIMLAAREYGIGPAQALNGGLHIIEGKVELSARLMSALIRRAKHTMQIISSTDKVCTIKGTRSDTGEEHTVTYTIEQAEKAGLIKDKGGWKKNPEDMLYARAASRLARQLFSDVIGIGYVEGEISQPESSLCVLEPLAESDPTEERPVDEEWALLEELFRKYEKEDHFPLSAFIDVIAEHYKKSRIEVIKQFLEDPIISSNKFANWKNTRKT